MMRISDEKINKKIMELMDGGAMCRSDVAEAIGISESGLSLKLSGKRSWTLGEIQAVAWLYEVEAESIFKSALVERERREVKA
jgi:DNA transposition AAA+ family ATPase